MLEMGIEDPFSIFDGAGVAIVFTEAKAPQHVDDELNNLGVCNILLKIKSFSECPMASSDLKSPTACSYQQNLR